MPKRKRVEDPGSGKKAKLPRHEDPRIASVQAPFSREFAIRLFGESTSTMMMNCIESCLLIPKHERHDFQVRMTEQIKVALRDMLQETTKALHDADEAAEALEQRKAEHKHVLEEAKQKWQASHHAAQDMRSQHVAAHQDTLAAQAKQNHAISRSKVALKELEDFKDRLQELQCAQREFIDPLVEGIPDYVIAQDKVEKVMPLVKSMQLDGSLVSAVPTALLKCKDERRPFDEAVIRFLLEGMQNQMDGGRTLITDQEKVVKKCENDLKIAEDEVTSMQTRERGYLQAWEEAKEGAASIDERLRQEESRAAAMVDEELLAEEMQPHMEEDLSCVNAAVSAFGRMEHLGEGVSGWCKRQLSSLSNWVSRGSAA